MNALPLRTSDTLYTEPQIQSEEPQQPELSFYEGTIREDLSRLNDESGFKSEEDENSVQPGFQDRRPVIKFPLKPAPSRQDHFISLQKWEGIVLQVKKGVFLARLVDQTKEGFDEEAKIPIEEVSEDDRDLLQPGAVFYWNIGYLNRHRGQRIRTSAIRFRRVPTWKEEELHKARREAIRIRDLLGWK